MARIKLGLQQQPSLGNLSAQRDWGFAGDYVRAIHLMLQQNAPKGHVIASGETHSVEDFCERAFAHAGLDWHDHVVTDPRFLRPAEVDLLIGDASRARDRLGWTTTTSFSELVTMMVDADLRACADMLGSTNGASSAPVPSVRPSTRPTAQGSVR